MKVALVYDRVNKWGGAERVLIALHEIFPDACLYTSVYNQNKTPWARVFRVKTSFLQYFPFASSFHEYYATFMPLSFESFSFDNYDLVVSVTSEAAKGIITKPSTFHLCYSLTPTRYLWSGYKEYFKNPILRFISQPFIVYLKWWDKVAASRPDAYIAISKEVNERIKKYYQKNSAIIYPPITLNPKLKISKSKQIQNTNYFLIVSRLVSYKRIDIAIKACNKLKLPLKIIGSGLAEKSLKKIAGENVEFLGNLTDSNLVEYYKGCRGLIVPSHEDFGLTILEAAYFGKPTIAYKRGGAIETIMEGKTGMFFYPQSTKALMNALRLFKDKDFSKKALQRQAQQFNKKRFKKQLLKFIKNNL